MLMSANPLDWPKSTDLDADAEADECVHTQSAHFLVMAGSGF